MAGASRGPDLKFTSLFLACDYAFFLGDSNFFLNVANVPTCNSTLFLEVYAFDGGKEGS